MEKRDYRLVTDGKYNRKAIIQRAWIYVRNYNYSLNFAMRMSWADAQIKKDEYHNELQIKEKGLFLPIKNLSLGDIAAGFMPVWRIDHVPK